MSNRQRFTPQQQQEQESLGQAKACFARVGWTESRPDLDLGEDAIFSIYYQGRATGVNLYLQVKSITNLEKRQAHGFLTYRFLVKDILHWERFAYPVVLLIWDVLIDEGRWILAADAVADLDDRRAGWRDQNSATVYVPCDNTTDEAGLDKLRITLGHRLYPIIAKDRDLTITVNFKVEPGPTGDRVINDLQGIIRHGDSAHFDSTVIDSVIVPEWFQPWIEPIDPDKVYFAVSSLQSDRSLWATLEAVGNQGTRATLSYLELRVVRAGTDTFLLSNAHQTYPLWIKLEGSRPSRTFKIHFGHSLGVFGNNVSVTKELIGLFQCLSEGGQILVIFAEVPDSPLRVEFGPDPSFRPDPSFVDLVDNLCRIQDAMNERLRIPPEGVSRRDAQSIDELIEIIDTGKTIRTGDSATLNIVFRDPEGVARILRDTQPVTFAVKREESCVPLFGLNIALGPMTRVIQGRMTVSVDELRQELLALAPGSAVELRLTDCTVTESFERWGAQT